MDRGPTFPAVYNMYMWDSTTVSPRLVVHLGSRYLDWQVQNHIKCSWPIRTLAAKMHHLTPDEGIICRSSAKRASG